MRNLGGSLRADDNRLNLVDRRVEVRHTTAEEAIRVGHCAIIRSLVISFVMNLLGCHRASKVVTDTDSSSLCTIFHFKTWANDLVFLIGGSSLTQENSIDNDGDDNKAADSSYDNPEGEAVIILVFFCSNHRSLFECNFQVFKLYFGISLDGNALVHFWFSRHGARDSAVVISAEASEC